MPIYLKDIINEIDKRPYEPFKELCTQLIFKITQRVSLTIQKLVSKSKVFENTAQIYWTQGIFEYLLPKLGQFSHEIKLADMSSFLEFCTSSKEFEEKHHEFLI